MQPATPSTYLGFAGNGSDIANLAALQGVDHAALANVGIANEADGDLLLVRVECGKLAEKRDEGAFAKGMVRRGMEGESRVTL